MKQFYWALKIISGVGFIIALTKIPGKVTLEWFTYTFQTTLPVFFLFLTLFYLAAFGLIWLFRFPGYIKKRMRLKRLEKQENEHGENIVRFFAKEYDTLHATTRDASRCIIFAAYGALFSGRYKEASGLFEELSTREDAAFIGHEGLYQVAYLTHDDEGMRSHLKQAMSLRPHSPWVKKTYAQSVFFKGSLSEKRHALGMLETLPDIHRKDLKAIIAYKNYLDPDKDHTVSLEALVSLIPEAVPLQLKWADYLYESHEEKKALKALQSAYNIHPHYDIAYKALSFSAPQNPMQRFEWLCEFTKKHEDHVDTFLIRAYAAMDAQLWGQAEHYFEKARSMESSARLDDMMRMYETKYSDGVRFIEKYPPNPDASASQWICSACKSPQEKWELVCTACASIHTLHWSCGGKK
jgi:HemY protein